MENYNLTADQYADMFSDFYINNEDTYGENMEEAYADFEEALNAEIEAEQFEAYYSNAEGLYDDTEEGLEEAYADFQAFQDEESEDEDEDEDYDDEEYEDEESEDEDEEEYSDEDQAFLDFYSETQDIYGDNVEEAYADFVEFTEEVEEEDTYSKVSSLDGKSQHNWAAHKAVGGAITGSVLAQVGTSYGKEARRRKELKAAKAANRITEDEKAELNKLISKRTKKKLIAAGVGGALGAGDVYVQPKKYGMVDKYSAEDFDNDFMDFYAEAEELYESNIEEAYADFEELMDEEYGIKDVASKIGKSIKAAGSKISNAGSKAFDKTQKFIHTHIAEPGAAGNAVHHGARYADENENEEEVYSDEELGYLTLDEFSEGFAEFYSEMEDAYGEEDADLEEAYDDYADLVAEQELELMFSEDDSDESETEDKEYGFMDKAKELGGKAKGMASKATGNKTVQGVGIGAGAGLAAGLIAGSVGKDAKERRALKSKSKSGALTATEAARYSELKKSRRNKIAGGALAGAAVGGAVANKDLLKSKAKSLGGGKSGSTPLLTDGVNSAEDTEDTGVKEKEFSAEDTTSQVEEKEVSKDKIFSAADLIGKPGLFNLGSTKANKVEDKTFSSSDKGAVKISTGILGILGK